jgi:pimeloyl-ACP methyl ester carboxylesterase
MSRKIIRILAILFVFSVFVYAMGPRPEAPEIPHHLPQVPQTFEGIKNFVDHKEAAWDIKPGNQSILYWHLDSAHRQPHKTRYALVYLHGFTASPFEGLPTHQHFAETFGYNFYAPLLDQHGLISTDPLQHMRASALLADAAEALAIGLQMGDQVILMSTSMGSTLALTLAAQFPNEIAAVINISPNIRINDRFVKWVDGPWGLYLARLFKGGKFMKSDNAPAEKADHWYTSYRLEAVTELQSLVENTMTAATFRNIQQPVLSLYWYKNAQVQDPVVKVSAILEMHDLLGTPPLLSKAIAIPEAGHHVMGSSQTSKALSAVQDSIQTWWKQMIPQLSTK